MVKICSILELHIIHADEHFSSLNFSSQSISIEYKVDSTSMEHDGNYKCIAKNAYGTSERSVEIIVLSRRFTKYKLIENHSNVKIPCNLSPELKSERTSLKWFFGKNEIFPDNVYKVYVYALEFSCHCFQ